MAVRGWMGSALLVLVTGLALEARVEAREVWLNGIKLDPNVGVKTTRLAGCDVLFDEKGDVHIVAKGIKVEVAPVTTAPRSSAPAPAPAPAPRAPAPAIVPSASPRPATPSAPPATAPADAPRLAARYWLAAPQKSRARVGYDVDVFLNGTLVTRLRADDERTLVEITRHVRPGGNVVKLSAIKRPGAAQNGASPADVMEIVVGEGRVGQGTVTIDKPLVTYRRNASETRQFADEYPFRAR